jgi:hypothetical protein
MAPCPKGQQLNENIVKSLKLIKNSKERYRFCRDIALFMS